MKKQLIAKLLVLAMVLAMVPATILAASAVVGNSNSGYNYGYYSINADTVVKADEVKGGVIDAKVIGGVVLVELNKDDEEKILTDAVKDGVLTLELTAEGAEKYALTVTSEVLVKVLKDAEVKTFVFKTPAAVATIPADKLIEAVEESSITMFMAEPAAESVVTVYADWVAVDFEDDIKVEVAEAK